MLIPVAQLYVFHVNLIDFPTWVQSMCVGSAKLADFSKSSLVHPRQFCKSHSIRGFCHIHWRSAACAEAPANMAETTNEQGQGTALIEDYYSPVVGNKNRESESVIQITGRKNPTNPTNSTTDPSLEVFPREFF